MKFANFLRIPFFPSGYYQQQLSEGVANGCYKIVSQILLQELIYDFATCKHCSGTLLPFEDVTTSHSFGN